MFQHYICNKMTENFIKEDLNIQIERIVETGIKEETFNNFFG